MDTLKTIPNFITLFRIVFTFILFGVAISSMGELQTFFIIAGTILVIALDVIDGIVARRLAQTSLAGEILDQLADSVGISGVMIIGTHMHLFPLILCLLYVFREFWVYALRRYAAIQHIRIPSITIGKYSSFITSTGLLGIIIASFTKLPISYSVPVMNISLSVVWLGIITTYVAAYFYTYKCVKELKNKKERAQQA
jgi:CDP-diacylglycerol--glycerol-3-phosphate 3-phosphatidyltransferase